jgi:hypothetical protein
VNLTYLSGLSDDDVDARLIVSSLRDVFYELSISEYSQRCVHQQRSLTNSTYDIHTLKDLAKHNMTTIEPAGDGRGDEELTAVGVLARVSHAEDTWGSVLELEVLVVEAVTVDRFATGTVATGCEEGQGWIISIWEHHR